MLISSGQPSINPRLVKEADALIDAGYNVLVIYQYWNEWATKFDKELLVTKIWDSFRVGGSPNAHKYIYWLSRIKHKVNVVLAKKFGFKSGIAEGAIGRCTSLLYREAKKHPAHLYIAHNLAALPAAVKAAKKQGAKCGFDAEDYHRNEVSDDPDNFDVRLKSFIEQKYFPQTDFLTTSSKQIADRYRQLFPAKKIDVLLNVFPKNITELPKKTPKQSLKMFWFSQTIGLNRGIEDVLNALKLLEAEAVELHLLGHLDGAVKSTFANMLNQLAFTKPSVIIYHHPVNPEKITAFAMHFDIGLALEPGFSINNDSALSNKIFTYITAGLAIIASDTSAQTDFINNHASIGKLYKKGDHIKLANIIKNYIDNPQLLQSAKQASHQLNGTLNWENESEKFLTIVKHTLSV